MHRIQQRVQTVQIRQQRQWLWQCASIGLLAGGIGGCLMAMARILSQGAFSWIWVVSVVLIPALAGVAVALVRSKSILCAARLIDNSCDFKDRTQTALQFLQTPGTDPLRLLQIGDADEHLERIDLNRVSPINTPGTWNWGIVISVIAVLLAFISGQPDALLASVVSNSVVAEQASRAAEGLEELEQFQQEQNDPELEKLLKEMNEQLKVLAERGIDPKEALAKLSEMEAALEEMQKQVHDPTTEAQMQEIGEALSLAEAMAAAGQAMSKGEMEKAAEELSKMEMPELDRKTEKAVKEKLEQAQKNSGDSSKKKGLKEALEKMTQGISSGDKSKFQDGAKGLASECKKQGQKKKLSDLLKKQCQCLGECKSQCESECRNQAPGNKKGGNKAGKGSAGDPAGDKTAKNKTAQEMRLTGQDSGTGDVDVETTTNPEQEQEAVRQYREKANKYEAISEAALDSESIPLGHRQTIRRYFEMIRPQNSETDAVNAETESSPAATVAPE